MSQQSDRTYGYEPPNPHQPQQHARGPMAPNPGADERTMMLLAHLAAPASLLISGGWLPFLGPLLIWLFYKDRSKAVRVASAGAFNYNVSMTIVSWILWFSVIITFGLGLLWAVPIWIAMIIPHIKGVLWANRGEVYDYPFQIRLLS
ncbi:DUF4870 domain-containing protein [Ornithinimicrobium sp. Y1847]|uniref:DUF4870 domain-containing protein n=1 Tax=unclassified Ornithinimicrobium TaxID=2615080 RepID=UPI003B67A515